MITSTRVITLGKAQAAARILALAAVTAITACGSNATDDWAGGPVTPPTVAITANPNALPLGNAIATGITDGDQEIVLYFWGDRHYPTLSPAWLNSHTHQVSVDIPHTVTGPMWAADSGKFFDLRQLTIADGTLVEYGAVRGTVSRITCQSGDQLVAARFTAWSADPSVTIFWLRRSGTPVPASTPSGTGLQVPLAPEKYPLITAYGPDGAVLSQARLGPPAAGPKDG